MTRQSYVNSKLINNLTIRTETLSWNVFFTKIRKNARAFNLIPGTTSRSLTGPTMRSHGKSRFLVLLTIQMTHRHLPKRRSGRQRANRGISMTLIVPTATSSLTTGRQIFPAPGQDHKPPNRHTSSLTDIRRKSNRRAATTGTSIRPDLIKIGHDPLWLLRDQTSHIINT